MMESIILHILITYGAFQNFWKEKVHLQPPNNSLCSFNPINKILAQFTPSNNSSRWNIPPIKICLLFLGTQVFFLTGNSKGSPCCTFYSITDPTSTRTTSSSPPSTPWRRRVARRSSIQHQSWGAFPLMLRSDAAGDCSPGYYGDRLQSAWGNTRGMAWTITLSQWYSIYDQFCIREASQEYRWTVA
jgi:hypothetical protein